MSDEKQDKHLHIPRPTDEEDARIRAAAESDPDNPPLTAERLKTMNLRPFREVMAERRRTRGRPKAEVTKESVTIRLDHEIVEFFRETGAGWQTRMNDALAEYVRRQRGA